MRWSIHRSLSRRRRRASAFARRGGQGGRAASERAAEFRLLRDDDESARFSQVTHSRAPVTAKKYGDRLPSAADIKGEQPSRGRANPKLSAVAAPGSGCTVVGRQMQRNNTI
jgi:hypothetical protein